MTDVRELQCDFEEAIRTSNSGDRNTIYTALPCIVNEDSDGHTVVLQPAIKGKVTQPDGSIQNVNLPLLKDVPVHFSSGGGHTVTHPVKKGDEGIGLFSSRALDSWHQSGGIQLPQDNRVHSLSDAFFIPGIRSTPRKLNPPPSTTSVQMRSDDGNHLVDVDSTKGVTISTTKAITKNSTDPQVMQVGTILVKVSNTRVDLGGLGGSPVLTVAGQSTKVFAII